MNEEGETNNEGNNNQEKARVKCQVERIVSPVDDPDFCPTNCGGIVSYVGGGVYCDRCGYKEEL